MFTFFTFNFHSQGMIKIKSLFYYCSTTVLLLPVNPQPSFLAGLLHHVLVEESFLQVALDPCGLWTLRWSLGPPY